MKKIKIPFILLIFGISIAQDDAPQTPRFSDYQISSERYLTDDKGNIMMYVNVWGQVGNAGHHLVYEGIDLATLISVVGGPQPGANLKKTRIYREVPDENGTLVYHIDLRQFIESGNRSKFIKIKPNDTIIVPKKPVAYFLDQVGTINTVLSLINLYFQVMN